MMAERETKIVQKGGYECDAFYRHHHHYFGTSAHWRKHCKKGYRGRQRSQVRRLLKDVRDG